MNDTNVALYDSAGNLKSLNDDIAPGLGAPPTPPAATAPCRSAWAARRASTPVSTPTCPTVTDATVRSRPATTTCRSACAAQATATTASGSSNDYVTNLDVGNINWAVRSNYPAVGLGVRPSRTWAATGGVAGFDNHLDNNDFVVFIDFFFNHNPLADQGSTGGAPRRRRRLGQQRLRRLHRQLLQRPPPPAANPDHYTNSTRPGPLGRGFTLGIHTPLSGKGLY